MMEGIYAYFFLVIYSFIGWICECTYVSIPKGHFINRGFFYGPYIPIYGFGSLIALYPLLPFQDYPWIIFFLGAFLCSVLEYVTSWVMEKLFHMRWWDYSQRKFNLHGRVCLLNSTLFGCMLLVLVYVVHPFLRELIDRTPVQAIITFLCIFTVVWSVDFFFTLKSLIRRKRMIEKMRSDIEEFQANFQAQMEAGLANLEEKKLAFEQKKEEQKLRMQDQFASWLSQQENMQEKLASFHANMERIRTMAKTHIGHAFPDRHVSENWKDWKRMADELYERRKR